MSTMIFFGCYDVRGRQSYGTAKECSLHIYQVDGWMNGLINGWMGVSKNTEAQKQGLGAGAGRLSDRYHPPPHTHTHTFLSFHPVVLEKMRGCSENPADMKTVRYCFFTFSPSFPFKTPTLNPLLSSTIPPFSLWSHFKAVGTTQDPFSSCFCFFYQPLNCMMVGRGRCLNES